MTRRPCSAAMRARRPRAELDRMFYLDDADLAAESQAARGSHAPGLRPAADHGSLPGDVPDDPLDVPAVVLEHWPGNWDRRPVLREAVHRAAHHPVRAPRRDQGRVGLREFAEAEDEFARWATRAAWNTGDGPKTIFTDGVKWLRVERGAAARGDDAGPARGPGPGRGHRSSCTRTLAGLPGPHQAAQAGEPGGACRTARGTRTWSCGGGAVEADSGRNLERALTRVGRDQRHRDRPAGPGRARAAPPGRGPGPARDGGPRAGAAPARRPSGGWPRWSRPSPTWRAGRSTTAWSCWTC